MRTKYTHTFLKFEGSLANYVTTILTQVLLTPVMEKYVAFPEFVMFLLDSQCFPPHFPLGRGLSFPRHTPLSLIAFTCLSRLIQPWQL